MGFFRGILKEWKRFPPYHTTFKVILLMFLQMDYNSKEKELIRNFFSDDEWNAIDSALADYQDYGDKESELMSTIGQKMYDLFNTQTS